MVKLRISLLQMPLESPLFASSLPLDSTNTQKILLNLTQFTGPSNFATRSKRYCWVILWEIHYGKVPPLLQKQFYFQKGKMSKHMYMYIIVLINIGEKIKFKLSMTSWTDFSLNLAWLAHELGSNLSPVRLSWGSSAFWHPYPCLILFCAFSSSIPSIMDITSKNPYLRHLAHCKY